MKELLHKRAVIDYEDPEEGKQRIDEQFGDDDDGVDEDVNMAGDKPVDSTTSQAAESTEDLFGDDSD